MWQVVYLIVFCIILAKAQQIKLCTIRREIIYIDCFFNSTTIKKDTPIILAINRFELDLPNSEIERIVAGKSNIEKIPNAFFEEFPNLLEISIQNTFEVPIEW
jgi:hypothetical protein